MNESDFKSMTGVVIRDKEFPVVDFGFSGDAMIQVFKAGYELGEKEKVKSVVLDAVKEALKNASTVSTLSKEGV